MVAIATPPYQAMLNVAKDDGKPPLVFNSIVDPFAVVGRHRQDADRQADRA